MGNGAVPPAPGGTRGRGSAQHPWGWSLWGWGGRILRGAWGRHRGPRWHRGGGTARPWGLHPWVPRCPPVCATPAAPRRPPAAVGRRRFPCGMGRQHRDQDPALSPSPGVPPCPPPAGLCPHATPGPGSSPSFGGSVPSPGGSIPAQPCWGETFRGGGGEGSAPAGSGPAPTTKAGSGAAGTGGEGARASKPPQPPAGPPAPPRLCPWGSLCPGRARSLEGGGGDTGWEALRGCRAGPYNFAGGGGSETRVAPWGGRHRPRSRPGSPRARLVEAPGSPSPSPSPWGCPGGAEPRPGSAPVSCSSSGPGRDNFSCHGAGGALAPPRCGGGWIRLTALPASHLGSVAAPEGGDSTQKGGSTQQNGTRSHPAPPAPIVSTVAPRFSQLILANTVTVGHVLVPAGPQVPLGSRESPGPAVPAPRSACRRLRFAGAEADAGRKLGWWWRWGNLGLWGTCPHVPVSPSPRVTVSPCHRVPVPQRYPRCALAVPWGWVPWGRCGNAVGSWVARVCHQQKPHPGAGGPGCHRSRVAQAGGQRPRLAPFVPTVGCGDLSSPRCVPRAP